ncbi:hypothetical protein SDC9_209416 [bioreactor metagenome]|uniref:Uncharacterized protein n=1 Tax=bioreactor metagenome TaxID=1076179 RepID=A0A645JMX4_9ZZZZ
MVAGELGHGQVDHAHLGAVAVGDHNLMALLNEVNDGFCGVLHSDHLLGQIVAQGIAAQCKHNALHRDHPFLRSLPRFSSDLSMATGFSI